MRIHILMLMLCLWCSMAKGQDLSVATYNLRGNNSTDVGNLWADRKLLVVDLINKYKFDIVGLQETEPDMVGYLISAMPRFDSVGVFQKIPTGIMYNTTRLSLLSQGHFWLSATPDIESKGWDSKFERICVWANFKDLTTGLQFYVFSTHFDHVGSVARTNSVALVQQKITEIAGTSAVIFLGDLNFDQFHANYTSLNNAGLLKDSYNLAAFNHEKEHGTPNGFVIDNRRDRIDHIFLTNNLRVSNYDVALDTYNGKIPSDHYPVVAKVYPKYNELGDLYRQFPEDFEDANPVKATYAAGNITVKTGSWMLNQAILGQSVNNDRPSSGKYAVRMAEKNISAAYLQMNFDVTEGASKVTVQHSSYAKDNQAKWQLEYSKDQGASWQSVGPVFTTHEGNKQLAIIVMDISGNVRFRINKFGLGITNNGRLSIDDFAIYKRKKKSTESSSTALLAWQFASPSYTGSETAAASSFNHQELNSATLKRGAGLSASVNANSFASVANVSTGGMLTDTASAVANELYYQFEVKPKPTYKVSLSAIHINIQSDVNGGKVWYWKYSLDGVNYNYLAKPFYRDTLSLTSAPSVDLTNYTNLQNLSAYQTVYFRLYFNGASSGTVAIGSSAANTDYALAVYGSVKSATAVNKLAAWQFATPQSVGSEASKAATLVDNAVTVSDLERGNGLKLTNNYYTTPVGLTRSFASVTNVVTSANVADTSLAVANQMYFGFAITIKPNYKVSLYSLNYKVRISSGGAKVWYWKYSLDGVNFVKLAQPLVLSAATDTEGDIQPSIDLTSIDELQFLPSGTTIFLRLYTNGSNATTGTSSLGRSAVSTNTDYALSLEGFVDDGVSQQTTLPVKLIAFNSQLLNNQVKLTWQTAQETNNSHFEILRYDANRVLTVLGSVASQDHQGSILSYRYVDMKPLLGTSYYQLRQLDYDGLSRLSEIIKIKRELNEDDVVVYRKNERLYVNIYSDISTTAKILISDITGRKLNHQSVQLEIGANSFSWPILQPSGIYLVQIQKAVGQSFVKKIKL